MPKRGWQKVKNRKTLDLAKLEEKHTTRISFI
jgi:hypothetical protein